MSIQMPLSPMSMPTHLVLPERGSNYSLPTGCVTTKIACDQTGGVFTLREAIMAAGQGPAPHSHPDEDEAFYILEGSVTFWFESGTVEASAGTFIHSPKGTLHSWKNSGTSLARMLIFLFPDGYDLAGMQESGKDSEITPRHNTGKGYAPNHITLPNSGELLEQRFGKLRLLISAQESGSYILAESALAPFGGVGSARILQSHKGEDAAFYMLEGVVTFFLADRAPVLALPGTVLYCPQGTPYAFENRSDRPARMLNLLTPGDNMESYFRSEAKVVGSVPADAAPADSHIAELAANESRHGLESIYL